MTAEQAGRLYYPNIRQMAVFSIPHLHHVSAKKVFIRYKTFEDPLWSKRRTTAIIAHVCHVNAQYRYLLSEAVAMSLYDIKFLLLMWKHSEPVTRLALPPESNADKLTLDEGSLQANLYLW